MLLKVWKCLILDLLKELHNQDGEDALRLGVRSDADKKQHIKYCRNMVLIQFGARKGIMIKTMIIIRI